ncbi:ATP-binding cassette domain-containing protein, partial [Clostridioides difficile]
MGPNGSGKTTLIKLIVNLLQADEGKIYFQGKDILEN